MCTRVPHPSLLGVGAGIKAGTRGFYDQLHNQVTASAMKFLKIRSNFTTPLKITRYTAQVATLHTVVSRIKYTHLSLLPRFLLWTKGYCPQPKQPLARVYGQSFTVNCDIDVPYIRRGFSYHCTYISSYLSIYYVYMAVLPVLPPLGKYVTVCGHIIPVVFIKFLHVHTHDSNCMWKPLCLQLV